MGQTPLNFLACGAPKEQRRVSLKSVEEGSEIDLVHIAGLEDDTK